MTRGVAERSRARIGATAALLVSSLVVGLALCEIGARILWPHWTEFYAWRFEEIDYLPGYGPSTVGRAGFDGWFAQNDGDFRIPIKLNALGMRNEEPPQSAGGRLWIIGDSFAFGWGVRREESFGVVAGRLAGLPVYNLASPGTDVCGYQASIGRMPASAKPRAAILGLTIENDISDYHCPHGKAPLKPPDGWHAEKSAGFHFQDIKLFLMGHSALYNGLALGLKQFDVVNRALVALGLVAEPQVEHAENVPVLAENARDASSTVDELSYLRSQLPAGTPFAVLIIPARFDIRDRAEAYVDLRTKVVAELAKRGIAVIDPAEAFRAAGFAPTHFRHDGHWSPEGHAIAGRMVAAWLRSASSTRN